jgi:DNA-directed RNA polymerase subunit RPC12/RpoP
MAISKRTRYEVLRRDGHACRYCGAMAPDVKLHVDHVIPVALGGDDKPGNLVTACEGCNLGKASTSPDAKVVEDVKAADLALADALKRAAEEAITEAQAANHAEYVEVFHRMWGEWQTGPDYDIRLPDNWRRSIQRFAEAGLPEELLADALWIAMQNKRIPNDAVFRYMCGICWKKIRDIQDRAAEIMAEQAQAPVEVSE